MMTSTTRLQEERARKDAIKACYDSFRPYTCPGCEDYPRCQMARQDREALRNLAMILKLEGKCSDITTY